MAKYVVEPAVAVKWFIPEEHSSHASRLLDGGHELLSPDSILVEAAGIITAKVRLGEITLDEGIKVISAVGSVPFQAQPTDILLEPAMQIAAGLDVPFRDGMGVAVAVQAQCRLVTANRTLYDEVQGTPFAAHVKWVGDLR
ncbi:MAG: type II toxin-antitoxin system VapC family toxin [Pseudomonadota bacterium]